MKGDLLKGICDLTCDSFLNRNRTLPPFVQLFEQTHSREYKLRRRAQESLERAAVSVSVWNDQKHRSGSSHLLARRMEKVCQKISLVPRHRTGNIISPAVHSWATGIWAHTRKHKILNILVWKIFHMLDIIHKNTHAMSVATTGRGSHASNELSAF